MSVQNSTEVETTNTATGDVLDAITPATLWPAPDEALTTSLQGLADPEALEAATKGATVETLTAKADEYVTTWHEMTRISDRAAMTQTYAGAYAYHFLERAAVDGKIGSRTVGQEAARRLGFSETGGRSTHLKNVARLIFEFGFRPGDETTARLASAAQRAKGFGKAIDRWDSRDDAVAWIDALAATPKAVTRGPGSQTADEKAAEAKAKADAEAKAAEGEAAEGESEGESEGAEGGTEGETPRGWSSTETPTLNQGMTRGRMLTTLAELVVEFGAPRDAEEYARLTEIRDAIAVALDASDIAGE